MAWTNAIALEFLDLYRQEQHLWDPKHISHRNRTEVTEGWLRIQAGLSIDSSITDLKKKKESLMSAFRMHYQRKNKAPPGEYHTTWFAFSFMESFLGEKYEDNTIIENKTEFYSSPNSSATYVEAPVVTHQYVPRNSSLNKPFKQKCKSSEVKVDSVKNDHFLYTKRHMEEPVTYIRTSDGGRKEMDECDLYGQLLVRKLKKLNEHQRDVAMHEIDNIMFRAKMQGGSSRQTSNFSTSTSPGSRKVTSPLFIVSQEQSYEDENGYQEDPMEEENS